MVCTETCPERNWICSNSPPEAWQSRAQVRRRSCGASLDTPSGGFLHDVPNRLYRHSISPSPAYFVDPAEQSSAINGGRSEPIVEFGSHPIGNRNRPNMASLANQIDNGPMLFALLEMIQCQSHGFMPPQPT